MKSFISNKIKKVINKSDQLKSNIILIIKAKITRFFIFSNNYGLNFKVSQNKFYI